MQVGKGMMCLRRLPLEGALQLLVEFIEINDKEFLEVPADSCDIAFISYVHNEVEDHDLTPWSARFIKFSNAKSCLQSLQYFIIGSSLPSRAEIFFRNLALSNGFPHLAHGITWSCEAETS